MDQTEQKYSPEMFLSSADNFPKNKSQQIFSIGSCIQNGMQEQKNRFQSKAFRPCKSQNFSTHQLKNLFDFYDQYGPKWSNFQQLIPGRTQNQLKNKFHSTVRTLCRLIIAASGINQQSKEFISSSRIPSKILVDLYQGKKTFKKYKNFMKKMLQVMSFEINKEKEKIEKCRAVLGVTAFKKICDQLLRTTNYKNVYAKLPKNGQDSFIYAQEKKAASLEIGYNVDTQKKTNEAISPVQAFIPLKLEEPQRYQPYISHSNPTKSQFLSTIRQNNLQIMQKLFWANHLQQTTPIFYPTLPFPEELRINLERLSANLSRLGNNF